MAHTQLFRSGLTRIHFVRTLAAAYKRFMFLIDPDFATQNEVDAWNKIRRDPDIAHGIQKRRQGVAGLNWNYIPASDSKEDRFTAKMMQETTAEIKNFQQARFNLASSIFRGDSWAFIKGRRKPFQFSSLDQPVMLWTPEKLEHIDRFRFRIRRIDKFEDPEIRTIWELFSVKRERWEPITNPEWFIRHSYDQTEDTLGYGRGLMQSIFFFWRSKEIVLAQLLGGIERWAQGMIHVKVDGAREGSTDRTNDEIVDIWTEEMNKQKGEHILVADKRDEIEIHDWPARGSQMALELYNLLQRGIDRMILTSTLPTGGGPKGEGSFARGKVEQQEMEATIQADRESLSEAIDCSLGDLIWSRNKLVYEAIARKNGLTLGKRPKFRIIQKRIEDPRESATIIQTALNSGMPVLRREAYTMLGLTVPNEDDDVIVPPASIVGGGASLPNDMNNNPTGGNGRGSVKGDESDRKARQQEGLLSQQKKVKQKAEKEGKRLQGKPCRKGQTPEKTGCRPTAFQLSGDGNGRHTYPTS